MNKLESDMRRDLYISAYKELATLTALLDSGVTKSEHDELAACLKVVKRQLDNHARFN